MIISKKRFKEEIGKALLEQEERRHVFERIECAERNAHERIERLERRVFELEASVKQPISMECVGLPMAEVKTTNF